MEREKKTLVRQLDEPRRTGTEKEKFRVIIAGSWQLRAYDFLKEKCNRILKDKLQTHQVIIVSNHDRGAACLGERYAKEMNLQTEIFITDISDGKRGIHIRNEKMVKASDALIFFVYENDKRYLFEMAIKHGLKNQLITIPESISEQEEYRDTKHDPVAAILAQRALCEKEGSPLWVTSSWCPFCKHTLFSRGGIDVQQAGKQVITSCPFCHHSFLD